MAIIVKKDANGDWQEYSAINVLLTKNVSTREVIYNYADGRQERTEEATDPYPVDIHVSTNNLAQWSDAELLEVGLKRATPFVVSEGKSVVGSPTYIENKSGIVEQIYEEEDIPAPEPQEELSRSQKFDQLAEIVGLTSADLLEEIKERTGTSIKSSR